MRRALRLTFAFALSAPTAQAQRATLDRIVHRDTLSNGLTVVVVENHNVPLVTAEVVFRGGASTQTPDLQGVPHLFDELQGVQ